CRTKASSSATCSRPKPTRSRRALNAKIANEENLTGLRVQFPHDSGQLRRDVFFSEIPRVPPLLHRADLQVKILDAPLTESRQIFDVLTTKPITKGGITRDIEPVKWVIAYPERTGA